MIHIVIQVLRPYSNLSNLKIWEYYLSEDLAHGPSFEIDITAKEIQLNEEEITDNMPQTTRKVVNGCYDNINIQEPNVFVWNLQVSIYVDMATRTIN